jgi:formate hydrogenlyase subunit 4
MTPDFPNLSFTLFCLLNTGFVLLVSPFYMSLIKKVKAAAQGRKGPRLLQNYYDLCKLLHREVVYSPTSSGVMRVTPYLNLAVLLLASLFVPVIFIPDAPAGIGNIIVFIYLLAIERFFTALCGLDAGSTFGGMGSSRAMSLSAVIEPTMVISFAALSYVLKTVDLHKMFAITSASAIPVSPTLVLVSISLFIIIIVETGRLPVDNPATHLELTMINEAMILEQSGKNLALIELTHSVKQTLLMAVLINILVPVGLSGGPNMGELAVSGLLVSGLAFLVKAALLAVVIGLFESSLSKMRLFRLPVFYMMAFFFSALTILMEVFA